jgi:hypothetical protein
MHADDITVNLKRSSDVVTISAAEVKNRVWAKHGTLDSDYIAMVADSVHQPYIWKIDTTASVTGTFTHELYIPNQGAAGWYYTGPVMYNTSTSILDWDQNIITTGFPGADYEYSDYPFVNMYWYDETLLGDRNIGWTPATDVTEQIGEKAWSVYSTMAAVKIPGTGTPRVGDTYLSYTYTDTPNAADGWNLLWNPMPCQVDWISVESSATSDLNNYYVWSANDGNYLFWNAAYNYGSAQSASIQQGQGFFVKAESSGSLVFREEDKTEQPIQFERDLSVSESGSATFSLRHGTKKDVSIFEQTTGTSDGWDPQLDTEKLRSSDNSAPQMWFDSERELSLSATETPGAKPMKIKVPAGTHTFTVEDASLPSCSYIVSVISGDTIPVESGQTIEFSTEIFEGHAFDLVAGEPLVTSVQDGYLYSNWEVSVNGQQVTLPYMITENSFISFDLGTCHVDEWFIAPFNSYNSLIEGPATVNENETGVWTGECDFDYDHMEWHVDGILQVGDYVSTQLSEGAHHIDLDVYGLNGEHSAASMDIVSVHSSGIDDFARNLNITISDGEVIFGKYSNYTISDAAGKTVARGQSTRVSMDAYPKGIYFLRVGTTIVKVLI